MRNILGYVGTSYCCALYHELGHALTSYMFGASNIHITIGINTGRCSWTTPRRLSFRKNLLIDISGPILGMIGCVLAYQFSHDN